MWASQTVQHSSAWAGDVLPLLAGGQPANWKGDVIFHQDKIAACPPDLLLTIDAWDLS